MVTFGLPNLLLVCLFLQGLHQLHQARFLWQELECLETWGLQQVEFAVAGSEVEGLYDILQEAMTWPEPSTSVGPPLPKRCRQVPTTTVSQPTAQEVETPSPVPQPQGGNIPVKMTPLCVSVGDAHWVYCCPVRGALRDPHPPMPQSVVMCTMPIWAQSCCVPSAPIHSLMLMPSNGMASGHITLDLWTQLKECYTCVYI